MNLEYKESVDSFEQSRRTKEFALEFYIYRLLKQFIPNLKIQREYKNIFDLYIEKSFVKKHKGKPLYIEVKQKILKSGIRHILNLLERIEDNPKVFFIIIVQEKANYFENIELNNILEKYSNIDVKVWSVDFLRGYIRANYPVEHENDLYNEYINNPLDFLIQSKLLEKEEKDYSDVIISLLKENKLTLFLGAGVSSPSNLPKWEELIESLLNKIIPNIKGLASLNSEERKEICNLIIKDFGNNPLTQVRYLKSMMKQAQQTDFYKLLHESMYERNLNTNTDLLNNIRILLKEFSIKDILTYNFDDILEQNHKTNQIKYKSLTKSDCIRDPKSLNVYHIHGLLSSDGNDVRDIIFSEEEYHKAYSSPYDWTNITQLHFLRSTTGLFIGCSLTDPNMRRILDTVKEEEEGRFHYAFMLHEVAKAVDPPHLRKYREITKIIKEIFYHSIGIRVIWVKKYDDIPKMLEKFCKPAKQSIQ